MEATQHRIMALILAFVESICLLSSCQAHDALVDIPTDIEISSAAEITYPLIVTDGVMYAVERDTETADTGEFVSLDMRSGKGKMHGPIADYTLTPSGNCEVLDGKVYKTFAKKDDYDNFKVYLYALSHDSARKEFVVSDKACSGLNYIEVSDEHIYIKCLFLENNGNDLVARIMRFDLANESSTIFLEKVSTAGDRVGEQIMHFAYNRAFDSIDVLLCIKDTPYGEERYCIDSFAEDGTFIRRSDITEQYNKIVDSAVSKMIFYGNYLFIQDWSSNILLTEYDAEKNCYTPVIVSDIEFSLQPVVCGCSVLDENNTFAVFRFTGLERYNFLVLFDIDKKSLKYCSLDYLGLDSKDVLRFLFVDGNSIYFSYEDHAPDEEEGLPSSERKYEVRFAETSVRDLCENVFFEQTFSSDNPILYEKLSPASLRDE